MRCCEGDRFFHLEVFMLAFEGKKTVILSDKKPQSFHMLIFLWEDLNIFLCPSSAALLSHRPCSCQFLLNLQHIPTTIQPSTNLRQSNIFSDDATQNLDQFSSGDMCLQEQETFLRGSSVTHHSEKGSNTKLQTAEFYYGGNLKPDTDGNCQQLLLHI